MFNSPCLMYHCWKDAERESRRNPDNGNGGNGCLAVLAIIFMCCVFKAAFQVGGFAIIIAFAMLLGLLQGLFGNK